MTAPPTGEERRAEIIIVRRKKGGGDGHHGGAWKIAFADFMTAMMALFLVLWLVNAANEETKKSVASYFNPVKLVDRHRSERGLSEADGPVRKAGEGDAVADPVAETGEETTPEGPLDTAAATRTEGEKRTAAFFDNADAAIAALTDAAADMAASSAELSRHSSSEEAPERLRDPFATDIVIKASMQVDEGDESGAFDPPAMEKQAAASPIPDEPAAEAFAQAVASPASSTQNDQQEPGTHTPDAVAEKLRAALDKAATGTAGDNATVTETPDGTLIALTDSAGEPMFERSSAHPTVMLVQMLNALAETLGQGGGTIRISGHTDATPFSAASGYDNWRLSTDRANAARMILERAGVAATTISSVTGVADRRPIIPDDRFADENRRIEILLEKSV